ncbi:MULTISPECIES: M20/M25/M40 family metallo-hydrolase [Halobacterium]|uniref:M20/M25/M40 family metallo-hydrolase n=1 Tax=Halobacterium TaxID=2239 RepID=UPI0019657405|nr:MULTISPECIES: M42 family metallopeptidase [Halobacterium]MCF2165308.1 M42 family metallopeptidase [Halobacterium salinarum]MCF2167883.1 M42 family metallopeptidase [Halobacterium salinarum]MCF2238573.1 M42 family metallopeptidase [Halobacterium salinarum]QRY21857.1 M42 family metallopeptidase [Halobacterium sp. GSL-19]WJK63259.1 M42 family metallopeptidase [Halobacterium salinarum]
MDDARRAFLDELLAVHSPTGHEAAAQRVWVEYVSQYADRVETDAYGNAVAVAEGDAPAVAFTGHADEIGFAVAEITEGGFVRIAPIGGLDASVTRGSQVRIETDDGPVNGVIGQAAVHLRDHSEDGAAPSVTEQYVDIGAADGDDARDRVSVGDPGVLVSEPRELAGGRLNARSLDNRTGLWVAAEGFRRAVERDVDATVYAVSTVHEEIGTRGARMVGFDLDVDAVVAADVTHAADDPMYPAERASTVALGDGPVVMRGGTNHPVVVSALRDAAADAGASLQVAAHRISTGTDADAFGTAGGGVPTADLGIPNRYMHTPAEVVDLADLAAGADVLAAFAAHAGDRDSFAVSV